MVSEQGWAKAGEFQSLLSICGTWSNASYLTILLSFGQPEGDSNNDKQGREVNIVTVVSGTNCRI